MTTLVSIKTIEELETIFKMVDTYINQENVDAFFKFEYLAEKIENQLTNFVVHHLETHNLDKAKPYNMTF